jgi:hypothetical protein
MTACKKIEKCPFFNDKLANMPLIVNTLKDSYCRNDFAECARFIVSEALGGEKVPIDLYPNNKNRARQILAGNNHHAL